MFWVFNFNSRYYFKANNETGRRRGLGVDNAVVPKQAKGATGPELKVVLGGTSSQNPVELALGGGVGKQIDEADRTSKNRYTGRPAERSAANTENPDPDQKSALLTEVGGIEVRRIFNRIRKEINGREIYGFLQQLFKDNPELAELLNVAIRDRDDILTYNQLSPLVTELRKYFMRNKKDLILELEKMLRSVNETQLDSGKDPVKKHTRSVEELMTVILRLIITQSERGAINPQLALVIFLACIIFIPSWISNPEKINRFFGTGSVAYALEQVPPTPAPVTPTTDGGGQQDQTEAQQEQVPPTPAPVTPTTDGGGQETTTATKTPNPTETPKPTIQVTETTVTVTPTATIVTATVKVPETPAPVTPTTDGGEQKYSTATPTGTATASPTASPTSTATRTATMTIIIPTATPTRTPEATTTPTPKPPTETPEAKETPIPTETATVIIEMPTGETIRFEIPPTATAALLGEPTVKPVNTSGALRNPQRENLQLRFSPGSAMVGLLGISLIIGGFIVFSRSKESKKK